MTDLATFAPGTKVVAGRHLRQAIDVIEEYGWQTGDYGDVVHGFCAVGALQKVADKNQLCTFTTIYALRYWLRDNGYMDELYGVEYWNDNVAASKEDVLATLRKAADDLDPQTWVEE